MERNCSDSENSDDEWKQAWDPDSDLQVQKSHNAAPISFHENNKDPPVVTLTIPKSDNDSTMVSRMQLNDNKAGMEGLDKEKINSIIYEASKGSKYYENELKKEAQMNRRVLEQKRKLDSLSTEEIKHAQSEADELLQDLEKSRDLSRSIVHIDMDAFYAAVEMRDRPELKDKPMAVGGNSMLSTSNYVARKYGVRAAMPGFIGKKLCPQLVIVPTNFDKYTAVSKQVRAIMAEYDPNFCPMSLDEAYLNMTDHVRRRSELSETERSFPQVQDVENCVCRDKANHKTDTVPALCSDCGVLLSTSVHSVTFGLDVEEAVREMRHRIHLRTRLTASAGIAPNTMLAKVCSDKNKPNGQYRIKPDREEVMSFVKNLPIRKVSGIGKVSERMLSALGVVTCADLYLHRGVVYHLYSSISFNYFMRITLGLGSTSVSSDGERKSLSTERTFSELSRPEELYKKCEEMCQALTEDLQQELILGKTVTLKIKTVKFEVKTRAQTLADYTCDYHVIHEATRELLRTEIQACQPQPLRLRLMGVRLSNLAKESEIGKKRQNTITAFLKKHSSPEKLVASPSKLRTVSLSASETRAGSNTGSTTKAKKSEIQDLFNNMSKKQTISADGDNENSLSTRTDVLTAEGSRSSQRRTKKSDMLDLPCNTSETNPVSCFQTKSYTAQKCTETEGQRDQESPCKAKTSNTFGLCDNMSQNTQKCISGTNPISDGKSDINLSETSANKKCCLNMTDSDYPTAGCEQINVSEQITGPKLNKGSSKRKSGESARKAVECVDCPVCHRLIKSSNMKVITEHIEYCLSKQDSGRSTAKKIETIQTESSCVETLKDDTLPVVDVECEKLDGISRILSDDLNHQEPDILSNVDCRKLSKREGLSFSLQDIKQETESGRTESDKTNCRSHNEMNKIHMKSSHIDVCNNSLCSLQNADTIINFKSESPSNSFFLRKKTELTREKGCTGVNSPVESTMVQGQTAFDSKSYHVDEERSGISSDATTESAVQQSEDSYKMSLDRDDTTNNPENRISDIDQCDDLVEDSFKHLSCETIPQRSHCSSLHPKGINISEALKSDPRKDNSEELCVIPLKHEKQNITDNTRITMATVASGEKMQEKYSSGITEVDCNIEGQPVLSQPSPSLLKISETSHGLMDDHSKRSTFTVRENVTEYVCPVCNVLQGHSDLTSFHKHVDQCLIRQADSVSESTIQRPVSHEVVPCKISAQDKVQQVTDQCSSTFTKDKMYTNVKEDLSVPSTSTCIAGDMTEYICPICNILQDHPNLTSFNKHVDNCLSRQTIKEILKVPEVKEGENRSVDSGGQLSAPQTVTNHKRSPSVSKSKEGQSTKRRKLNKGLQTLEGFIKSRNS